MYEDENDNYNYKKGAYSTITFKWNDAKKVLTIGEKKGLFSGRLETRAFRMVVVSKEQGVGVDTMNRIDKIVDYNGSEKKISIQ